MKIGVCKGLELIKSKLIF